MKRMIMTLVAVWMMITSMNAQRLTNIQAEARFITCLLYTSDAADDS